MLCKRENSDSIVSNAFPIICYHRSVYMLDALV